MSLKHSKINHTYTWWHISPLSHRIYHNIITHSFNHVVYNGSVLNDRGLLISVSLSLILSQDSNCLLTGGNDKIIRIYDLNQPDEGEQVFQAVVAAGQLSHNLITCLLSLSF